MTRKDPVLSFAARPPPGPLKDSLDTMTALFGKVVSLSVSALLLEQAGTTISALFLEQAGVTITDAASGAGTALTTTRTAIDFENAGIDAVRVVARGENSGSNAITIQVFNTTTSAVLATATITGTSEQTGIGNWTALSPNGGDEEVEVRVIGDGADDPILYGVHLQMRTQAAAINDAASGAGTALTTTRTAIDFQDAGIDAVRVIARGKNSSANAITVQVFNTTTSVLLASATITGTSEQTAIGAWTTFLPNGGDEQIEVRVIGDGADDPTLYGVHLQMRTQQARA